jgi:hypothetical protein
MAATMNGFLKLRPSPAEPPVPVVNPVLVNPVLLRPVLVIADLKSMLFQLHQKK